MSNARSPSVRLVVCVRNDGYSASLEPRKLYVCVPDRAAAAHRLLRVIDESGEDYLYPASYFRPITVPLGVRRALRLRGLPAKRGQQPTLDATKTTGAWASKVRSGKR
jgi:hypothetical protein